MRRERGAGRERLEELAARARRPGGTALYGPAGEAPEVPHDPVSPDSVSPDPVSPDLVPRDAAPPRPSPAVRPAAAVAALVLAVAVVAVAWARTAGTPGQVVDVPARSSATSGAAGHGPSPRAGGSAAPPVAVASAPAAEVVVDVQGRVRRPGLARLPAGSRVADAVRVAGGADPGAALARVNLARVLVDGEQLVVPGPDDPVPPSQPPPGAAAGAGPAAGGAAAGVVDLNTATVATLDALPGVGPVLAGRIVAWREAHGRFTTVDELGEVPGVGPRVLERLRALVRV